MVAAELVPEHYPIIAVSGVIAIKVAVAELEHKPVPVLPLLKPRLAIPSLAPRAIKKWRRGRDDFKG
jgi:hypothetical protein